MSKHTPGPWKTIPSIHGRKYRCVQLGDDEMYTTTELLPADAKLMAAAPDLLYALQCALKGDSGWQIVARDAVEYAGG